MGMKNTDSEVLLQLKAIQASNCRKAKPWEKSTEPKTLNGKQKVTKNLPSQEDRVSKVVRNLEKLNETLAKVRKREERSRKKQLTALQKLETLVKKASPKI